MGKRREVIDCPDCGPGTADENGYCNRCGMCLVTLPDQRPTPEERSEPNGITKET